MEIKIKDILMKQFMAAGDTQWVNTYEQENPSYIVNRLWLNNFARILVDEVLKLAAENATSSSHCNQLNGPIITEVDKESITEVSKLINYEN